MDWVREIGAGDHVPAKIPDLMLEKSMVVTAG